MPLRGRCPRGLKGLYACSVLARGELRTGLNVAVRIFQTRPSLLARAHFTWLVVAVQATRTQIVVAYRFHTARKLDRLQISHFFRLFDRDQSPRGMAPWVDERRFAYGLVLPAEGASSKAERSLS